MSFVNRLLASVEPGERALVRFLLLLSFSLGITLVYVDVASRALFLEHFPAEQLPYAYLGSAAVIPAVGLIFSRLQRRLSFGRLAIGMVSLLLLSLAALWAGIAVGGLVWPIFVLMIWYRLFYAFNGLLFWGLAGQLFTLRQGKRLFGLVGTGEPVAGVLGYFSGSLVAGLVGTQQMLLIAGAGLLLSMVALVQIDRLGWAQPSHSADAPLPTPAPERPAPRRYTLLIIAVAVAAILCYLLADYSFSAESGRAFQSAEQLATFFGIFFGAVAVGRIAFRSMVSGWLLRRFGLRAGLLVLPLAFVLGGAALLTSRALGVGGAIFILIALTRFLGSVLQPSIQRTAVQVLYQLLPARQRLTIQSLIEGMVEPVAIGVGSLLLLGLSAAGALSTLPVMALIVAIGLLWVALALRLIGDYRDTLGSALARRLLEGSALALTDASSRAVLERTLRSSHPGEVVYALGLLERADPQLLAARLPGLLDHPDPLVRREAVVRIGRTGDPAMLAAMAGAYEREEDPEVRAHLVRALDAADPRSAALLARAHADPAPKVRDAALLSDLRAAGAAASGYAARLRAMLADGDHAERARAARIIGGLGSAAWAESLIELFADGDAAVRREALRAAGRCDDQATLGALLDALGRPAIRSAAAAALVRRGEAVLPAIAAALARPGCPSALMVSLLRICGRIRGAAAVELLGGYLPHPDAEARHAAILALRRCGYRADGLQAQLVRAQIRSELVYAQSVQAALRALPGGGEVELLRAALAGRLAWLRQCIFALLELICDPRSIRRIELHIQSPAANLRDYAHELLELHVDAELRQLLWPVIEPPAARPAPPLDDRADVLRRLIGAGEPWVTPWISACALDFARRAGGADDLIAAARSSPSALVRETAAWAAGEPAAAGLPTVERVQILRTVGIFSATSDDVLAEVAGLLSLAELPDGGRVFSQGDVGDSMYVIVHGEVLIHDAAHVVSQLGRREVFGEMALLDAAPRSASATARGPALLLRLDQEPFYELMDDRIEVAHGVIRVLNRRLRASVRDLAEARAAAG